MTSEAEIVLLAGGGTLSPLPPSVKSIIIAMGLLGFASFVSCGLLFLYITYRVLKPRWAHEPPSPDDQYPRDEYIPDLPVSASRRQLSSEMLKKHRRQQAEAGGSGRGGRHGSGGAKAEPSSNSSLFLIHNLLMADMLQALAHTLALAWWRLNGIVVESPSCGAQGFFINLGAVSISLFLIAISINTLLLIVWGYRLPRRAVQGIAAVSWFASFAMAFIGLGTATAKAAQGETPYYARSVSLCWIDKAYGPTYGLWLQNVWLVASLGVTLACYAWIFISLLRHKRSPREMPPPTITATTTISSSASSVRSRRRNRNAPPEPSGHHPAFLLYPVVYLISSGPVTIAGMMASTGQKVGAETLLVVGAMSAVAGLLDAVLWSTTILFSSSRDLEEAGLANYDFMRTPSRLYGNMVWVEGATRARGASKDIESMPDRKWWRLNGGDGQAPRASQEGGKAGAGEENYIQMDTITTVTVDVLDSDKLRDPSVCTDRSRTLGGGE